MGNSNEGGELIKTNQMLFAISVEQSYMSCEMVNQMIQRWVQNGKPIFMVPKDFKDRIITVIMDQEVKLNYLKWLTQGLEIDMFEILTVLALYSRGSIQERLKILYFLYSSEEDFMSEAEFEFMIGKVSTSLGSTLSIKKTLLHEMAELHKAKLMPEQSS